MSDFHADDYMVKMRLEWLQPTDTLAILRHVLDAASQDADNVARDSETNQKEST